MRVTPALLLLLVGVGLCHAVEPRRLDLGRFDVALRRYCENGCLDYWEFYRDDELKLMLIDATGRLNCERKAHPIWLGNAADGPGEVWPTIPWQVEADYWYDVYTDSTGESSIVDQSAH